MRGVLLISWRTLYEMELTESTGERGGGGGFQVSSEAIPFNDNTFDLVFSSNTFHHITRNKHHFYTQEMHRVVKKTGMCMIIELNPLNLITNYRFKKNPIEHDARMLSPFYTKKLLQNQFGAIMTDFYSFFPQKWKRLVLLEKYLIKIPFGSLYTCTSTKR